MTVLVVAAHPDDEVLGCGGTIARLGKEGHEIHAAILGEGITSRSNKPKTAKRDLVKALRGCSRQVADLLGISELYFYDLPDNRFDSIPLLDVIKIVEKLIERLQPEVIYTHHGGDLNIDHVIVNRAVLTATRPVAGHPVKEIFAFEIASSTEWTFGQLSPEFIPNVYIDISSTLKTKVQAMELYSSETRLFPHPRSPEALNSICKGHGTAVGFEAAEAFQLIRKIVPKMK
jgi:LmbE family N-acetylglucosaminyl deacetylase